MKFESESWKHFRNCFPKRSNLSRRNEFFGYEVRKQLNNKIIQIKVTVNELAVWEAFVLV